MKNWAILVITTFCVPCFITLLISGTEAKEQQLKSGISIAYDNGENVDMEEFLPYMIAGEIDLNYEEETLKAQAVIARTNLMRVLDGKNKIALKDLNLAYLTPEKFEGSLGEKAREKMMYKLKKAVRETYGEVLVYENAYIEALYHEVSAGTTVSAEEIFGKSRPYLIAVNSSMDVESEEYMTVKEWRPEEVLSLLKSVNKGSSLTKDTLLKSLSIKEKTASGYVKQVNLGSETMSGDQWKEVFGLNSTNFYLEEYEGMLRIITLGKGHGIGFSQYGANSLAMDKTDYQTILKKYYPGTQLKQNYAKEV